MEEEEEERNNNIKISIVLREVYLRLHLPYTFAPLYKSTHGLVWKKRHIYSFVASLLVGFYMLALSIWSVRRTCGVRQKAVINTFEWNKKISRPTEQEDAKWKKPYTHTRGARAKRKTMKWQEVKQRNDTN